MGKRLATAAVGIPAAIFIINYGQWVFGLTILLLSTVAWHEYVRMVENIAIKPSYGQGLAIIIAILLAAWLKTPAIFTGVLVFAVLAMLATTVFRYGEFSLKDAAVTLLGILYVGIPFSHLLLLRYLDTGGWLQQDITPIGAWYLWLAFLGTWASDSFAYFVGIKYGKTKLAPAVSPAKTREGAAGGLIGCILVTVAFGIWFGIPIMHLIFIGLLVGIAAPLGDLAESVIKRTCDIKDSGGFFPGHGGVLDRFDSIMFAVPAVYYYVKLFVQ